MTDTEALSLLGGLAGGALVVALLFACILYVLLVIAEWKIFTKAGEAGWKALIPIYNVYVFCKIIGVNFWIYVLAIPFAVGLVTGIINNQDITNLATGIYSLVLDIYLSIRLGKAFGKSNGFIVGLVLLPTIFHLILGFDSSKYVGTKNN